MMRAFAMPCPLPEATGGGDPGARLKQGSSQLHLDGTGAVAALGDNLVQLGNVRSRSVERHCCATGIPVHAHILDAVGGAEGAFELVNTVFAAHPRNLDLAGLQGFGARQRLNLIHNQ